MTVDCSKQSEVVVAVVAKMVTTLVMAATVSQVGPDSVSEWSFEMMMKMMMMQ